MPTNTGLGANKQYEAILGTHEQYQNLNARWRFLLNSFFGGEIYRQGQYLTRYANESEQDFITRMNTTPLDNHVKGVLAVYNAFLFRKPPTRDFGSLEGDSQLEDFLEDANLEGQSFNSFMKDVSTYSGVFGQVWVIVTKPDVGAVTKADEIAIGARPYVNLLTPLAVLDWEWTRGAAGQYYLTYFKYMEDSDQSHIFTVKEWTLDRIKTSMIDNRDREIKQTIEETNGLGFIPAVLCYSQRSTKRGIGISDVDDIADIQRAIYNELSEIEQTIRISGHPSLVKTPDTEAVAGAGSIVQIPDNLDPGLKPYLLQPTGQNVTVIYESIKARVESIDKIANLGSARATKTGSAMSGIAMETEFQMLNARLSDKADNLELCEDQIWHLYCRYQGVAWDGRIEYPDTFHIQDKKNELSSLIDSRKTVTNEEYQKMLDYEIMTTALGDEDFNNYLRDPMMYGLPLPQPNNMNEVQQDALGLTNEQAQAYMAQITASTTTATTVATTATITTAAGDQGASCPIATQDVQVNLKNRQTAIDKANYGPMNPGLPNRTFWMAKAQMFKTTVAEAKTALCGNCAAFNKTTAIEACIDQGLAAGGSGDQAGWDTINRADLGYCEMWDFKCAATRTCDAWVTGGPVTDANANRTSAN